jgi:hypothetical protein
MHTKKLLFAAIVLSIVGILALWRIGTPRAALAAPAPEARKAPKEMLEKRRDAAKGAWEVKLALQLRTSPVRGNVSPRLSDLFGWSERWLDAELALCEKKEDRIAALKAHVDRTRIIEQFAIRVVKFARGTQADVKAATYERINAEIRYYEETGKEPPPPPKEKEPDEKLLPPIKQVDEKLPTPSQVKEERKK